MRELKNRTALITGASRGIGVYIAQALADEEMNLVLAARSAGDLGEVAASLEAAGRQVVVVPTDITDQAAREALIATAQREFGTLDVLVNNAGYLTVAAYHRLEQQQVETVVEVNLLAPMLLARLALPVMLAQGRGHIVNISSMAAKVGGAYIEPYCATKAGLNHFTSALRTAYRRNGVSASVVTPGFVEGAGMYDRLHADTGVRPPRLAGATSPAKVAAAVVRAIKADLPEVMVNAYPVWPLLVMQVIAPRLVERVLPRLAGGVYRRAGQILERKAGKENGAAHADSAPAVDEEAQWLERG